MYKAAIMKNEVQREVFIPGGFDILHSNHKDFILSCVQQASQISEIEVVTIGLASDTSLNKKGIHRPFFNLAWRSQDLINWWGKKNSELQLGTEILGEQPVNHNNRLVAISSEYKDTQQIASLGLQDHEIIFVPPINTVHTTNFENELIKAKEDSNCLRKVGAMLLRDGEAVSIANNGSAPDSCFSCSKYLDVKSKYKETGRIEPSSVPCDYKHAEASCLEEALEGDYLLTTLSPCNDYAESISEKGVSRVVYLEPYHDQEPLEKLMSSGVEVRMAGLPHKI